MTKADKVRDFVRTHSGVTTIEVWEHFKNEMGRSSVASFITQDVKKGFFEQKGKQLWLTNKGHDWLLGEGQYKESAEKYREQPAVPKSKPPQNGNGAEAREKIIGQYRTVNLQLLVKYSDLLLGSILDEIKDFSEVVDVRSTSVCAPDPKDVVVAVRFKR